MTSTDREAVTHSQLEAVHVLLNEDRLARECDIIMTAAGAFTYPASPATRMGRNRDGQLYFGQTESLTIAGLSTSRITRSIDPPQPSEPAPWTPGYLV